MLSDIFNYNSHIYCDINLVSMEELIYDELKLLKFDDKEKKERLEDLSEFKFAEFIKQTYFSAEIKTINSLIKNFGKLI